MIVEHSLPCMVKPCGHLYFAIKTVSVNLGFVGDAHWGHVMMNVAIEMCSQILSTLLVK